MLIWPQEISDALKELNDLGLTSSHIARTLNERFDTNFTRNAIIGRRSRMGRGGTGAWHLRGFSAEECALITREYAALAPAHEIARKLGRSEGTIRRKVRSLGLQRQRIDRFTAEDYALIKQDYAAFVPVGEIANKLGRSRSSIRRMIHVLGLRRPGGVSVSSWRREQKKQQKAEQKAEAAKEITAKCAEIDAREDLTRQEKMAAKYAAGMTLRAIGKQHGISHEPVRQIIKRMQQ